ncbi:MAG: hypothetical protein FD123_2341 [Bacteroidetes bacterium]|nr:MAG: hypothetical protein FD123_2341 [Bacteroidota bacterium]
MLSEIKAGINKMEIIIFIYNFLIYLIFIDNK